MTAADFYHLQLPHIEELVDQNLENDPVRVALSTADRVVADEVKYLQRARTKLPSWYDARCVIDSRLFEQSSSELTARAKFEAISGELAIDMTCGLGVDSAALAANFKQVIAVEIDPLKAEIARYNFAKLGIQNIDVLAVSAEAFCADAVTNGLCADLIFIDPSRVDASGKKVYSLDQSSPNVLKMIDLMSKISDRIIIKLSPLFDVDECFRLFADVQSVEIVSVGCECKEVNVLINTLCNPAQQSINHTVIVANFVQRYPIFNFRECPKTKNSLIDRLYLYVADVAFYKSRCVEQFAEQMLNGQHFTFDNYIFTSQPFADLACTGYIIEDELPYNPRKIKHLLTHRGITSATIHLRDFPVTQAQLYKTLKIKEGAASHLFFTTKLGEPTLYIVKPLIAK